MPQMTYIERKIGIALRDVLEDEAFGYYDECDLRDIAADAGFPMPTEEERKEAEKRTDATFTRIFKNDVRVWFSCDSDSYEFKVY